MEKREIGWTAKMQKAANVNVFIRSASRSTRKANRNTDTISSARWVDGELLAEVMARETDPAAIRRYFAQLGAMMAAMQTDGAADAMAHDGVLPETLVILIEA